MKKDRTRTTVSVADARATITIATEPVGKEQAGIVNSFGRTLAQDVVIKTDDPPRDAAAVDGFAAAASDTEGSTDKSPSTLSVLSDGSSVHEMKLEPGTVIPVNRGFLLPEGADCVIGTESVYRPPNEPQVMVMAELEPGDNVVRKGTAAAAGDIVLTQGAVMGSSEMGMLASLGRHGICVSRKPRIAIITTGARVVELVDKLEPGQIRNSTRYTLLGLTLSAGCELGKLIHVGGGRIDLENALTQCSGCDGTIIALGPAEKHGPAAEAVSNRGKILFSRVQMEPCGATAFGLVDGRPVFITSGDCVLPAFEALIRPCMAVMLGRQTSEPKTVKAVLGKTLSVTQGMCHYIGAAADMKNDTWIATPLNPREVAKRCVGPNSLIVIPADSEKVNRGETVDLIILAN